MITAKDYNTILRILDNGVTHHNEVIRAVANWCEEASEESRDEAQGLKGAEKSDLLAESRYLESYAKKLRKITGEKD